MPPSSPTLSIADSALAATSEGIGPDNTTTQLTTARSATSSPSPPPSAPSSPRFFPRTGSFT
ncbi:hypothetical protein CALCODRAFT_492868, partial [Calocera cornea HHB12733]